MKKPKIIIYKNFRDLWICGIQNLENFKFYKRKQGAMRQAKKTQALFKVKPKIVVEK